MRDKPKSVVVTGAESTGKSALCEWLAGYFEVPFLPEFARQYVENLGRRYTCSDVETIARIQVQQFNELRNRKLPLFFADTWLIITKIWFEEVYNYVPEWIEPEIRKADIDLFLVCDTDLPWIPDGVRENGGIKRACLQKRYIETIRENGFKYEIINGKNNSRFQNALHCLEQNGILKPNQV